jgi:2-polyprenyl-3-methyl-5-hydroxy-6-metoxy-1,4-benzoquinol methylase
MNAGHVIGAVLVAVWALHGLRLRKRACGLHALEPLEETEALANRLDDSRDIAVHAATTPDKAAGREYTLVTRPGVSVASSTLAAGIAYAGTNGILALDLLSPEIDSWRLMLVLATFDPRKYRSTPFARGISGADALLVDVDLLRRAGGEPSCANASGLIDLARRLKHFAPSASDVVLAPGVAVPANAIPWRERRQIFQQVAGQFAPLVVAFQYLLLAMVLLASPWLGLGAIAVFELQSLLVTLGTKLRPRDRVAFAFTRIAVDFAAAIGPRPKAAISADDRRAFYQAGLARGTTAFFDPRREDCPLCGAGELARVLVVKDRYQQKPGHFRLDRCLGCKHVFQNPRLSLEGLSFYYADFYDGLGEEMVDEFFSSALKEYRARVEMVAHAAPTGVDRHGGSPPRRWLDVGCGHGHFSLFSRTVLPDIEFHGLDVSESVEQAAARGWIQRGLRGFFPEVARDLSANDDRYDVVSMSHYLEHTRDPRAEIEAAASVVNPGGLLLIEVPDPESRLGRWLGRLWLPWFQPQHQHFVSAFNLERLLRENGFHPMVWHRGEAHQPNDFIFAAMMTVNCLAPRLDLPWRPRSGFWAALRFYVVWSLAVPLLALAWMIDLAIAPLMRRQGWSNVYRVLARRTT